MSADRLASFGALLRAVRRGAGLTQDELARSARVGVRTLRDLETGKAQRPQRSTIDLLATGLGLAGAARDAFVAAARSQGRSGQGGDVRAGPSLIGREAAIEEVADLLDVAGLVTLVGMGGMGKTALARAVRHRVADRFTGGVGVVAVTEASTESEILASLASALGAGRVEETFADPTGGAVLVVLDGADRSLKAAKRVLAWVRYRAKAGGRVCVLATGRYPLGLPDEHEWPVGPLDVPPASASGPEIYDYAATTLFLQRLRLVRARPVGLDEVATLKALVRRLGGVPLALELAAARGRVLELEEMLNRCGNPTPDAEPAIRCLREAVEANWLLLDIAEQSTLPVLATLDGPWSLELAEQRVGALVRNLDVVSIVDRFVALGLVAVRSERPERRFWLIEAVRDFALDWARGAAARRDAEA